METKVEGEIIRRVIERFNGKMREFRENHGNDEKLIQKTQILLEKEIRALISLNEEAKKAHERGDEEGLFVIFNKIHNLIHHRIPHELILELEKSRLLWVRAVAKNILADYKSERENLNSRIDNIVIDVIYCRTLYP